MFKIDNSWQVLGGSESQVQTRIAKCLSSAFDSALFCQVDTRGTLHKFAIEECACDICESHRCADKESNHQLVNSYPCH